jgi:hypothetical protein
MAERDLCRGWTASDIRAAVAAASEPQREVLVQIARNPGTTTAEIAEALGLESHLKVRGILSAFARTTNQLEVRDPGTGELSWPFQIREPADGSTFWRYYMPPEASQVVEETLGVS